MLAKTKFGKLANIASAGIDVGLIGRDYIKSKDKESEQPAASGEQPTKEEGGFLSGIADYFKSDPKSPENQTAQITAETNRLLALIASGGAGGTGPGSQPAIQSSNMMGMALGGGALALGGALLAKKTGGIFPKIAQSVAKPATTAANAAAPAAKSGAITPKAGTTFKPVTNVGAGLKAPLTSTAGGLGKAAAPAAKAGAGSAAMAAGKKVAGKLIPGVGLVMGISSGIDRAKEGDYLGAALDVGAGAAALIPGIS